MSQDVARVILEKNHSAGQILPMPLYRKTRVFFPSCGRAVYFPDHPDLVIDETESTYIDITAPREFVEENVPPEYIVAD